MVNSDSTSSLCNLRDEYLKNLVKQKILCEKGEALLMEIREEIHKLHMQRLKIDLSLRIPLFIFGVFVGFLGFLTGFVVLELFDTKKTISPAWQVSPTKMNHHLIDEKTQTILPHIVLPENMSENPEKWPAIEKECIEMDSIPLYDNAS